MSGTMTFAQVETHVDVEWTEFGWIGTANHWRNVPVQEWACGACRRRWFVKWPNDDVTGCPNCGAGVGP